MSYNDIFTAMLVVYVIYLNVQNRKVKVVIQRLADQMFDTGNFLMFLGLEIEKLRSKDKE